MFLFRLESLGWTISGFEVPWVRKHEQGHKGSFKDEFPVWNKSQDYKNENIDKKHWLKPSLPESSCKVCDEVGKMDKKRGPLWNPGWSKGKKFFNFCRLNSGSATRGKKLRLQNFLINIASAKSGASSAKVFFFFSTLFSWQAERNSVKIVKCQYLR